MLHLKIIVVNVLSLFFQIYNIECVENKHSLFLSLDSLCGLMAAKFGLFVDEDHSKLPTLYWLPKLHKRPYKSRFYC